MGGGDWIKSRYCEMDKFSTCGDGVMPNSKHNLALPFYLAKVGTI